ncbi:MAG: mandelate racemase/muconate lactonizing enzyme family protein [Gammaproteobacteria bacterium]|nr:mandelate racemase/muconate lactonizing enzyme family protein [Gammaproteobacteria bacterium]
MKITAVETILNPNWSNFLWVRIETDSGIVGLGETFRHVRPIETYLHTQTAEYLLGKDPRQVNRHAYALRHTGGNRFSGYPTRSVEIRANSAVDLALWDLLGKYHNCSVTDLIGGAVRDSIPIYNTCAGPGYNWAGGQALNQSAARGDRADNVVSDDLFLQNNDPGELARSLLAEGIRMMKIWPFDEFASKTNGQYISDADLQTGLSKIAAIREAVGGEMEIMIEYHGFWKPAAAERILNAVDELNPFWHEDIIDSSHIDNLAHLRSISRSAFAGSENHGSSVWMRDALNQRAIDYAHFDMGWVGGFSEALTVSQLCAAHDVMVAPHDCTGPVVWCANLSLALAMSNALVLESVRAYYKGAYGQLVNTLPTIENGQALPLSGVGFGVELSESLLNDPATVVTRSVL